MAGGLLIFFEFFLAVGAITKEDQVVGRQLKSRFIFHLVKEGLNFVIVDGQDLMTLLTHHVVMRLRSDDLIDRCAQAHIRHGDFPRQGELFQSSIDCGGI